ncbi:Guanylate kinase [Mesorhizobium loti]|nr:Guanylate kinase [Mesorhizobium loti]
MAASHGTTLSASATKRVGLARSIQPLRREVVSLMRLYIDRQRDRGNRAAVSQVRKVFLLPLWEKVDRRVSGETDEG